MSHPKPAAAKSSVTRRQALKATSAAAMFAALGSNFAWAQAPGKIKVGLIGCGGRGRGAAANAVEADPDVVITALGDLFPDRIKETEELWVEKDKNRYQYKDQMFTGWDAYKKVLATDVNYVILATPPGFRPMQIDAAIAAGKHIFAEKPVAVCPAGVRQILAAAELATQKNLGIVAGTQRRHDPAYIETIKRIHDGGIGKVLSGNVYWTQGYLKNEPRKEGWSDMEWQLRNWLYFTWLSGDIIVEQHVHNIDIANWVMGSPPKFAISLGGRQVRTDPAYGHIFDHFATDLEYPDGQRVTSMCRQIDGCYSRVTETFIGTEGTAIASNQLKGKAAWKYKGDSPNPYVQEHADLIKSIKDGKPLNEGKVVAESVLTAIMARMSAYTGQLVRWVDVMKSTLDLRPTKFEFGPLEVPEVPMPGKTKLV